MTRLTVPDVLPVVRALYERHSAGCCWHVVLDDGNVMDRHVAATVDYIAAHGCEAGPESECVTLCAMMPRMSLTGRLRLSRAAT